MSPAVAALAAAAAAGALALGAQAVQRERALARRLALLRPAAGPAAAEAWLLGAVTRLGMVLARSGLLSARTRAELEATLAGAGLRGAGGLGLFLGAKLLLMAALPGLVLLLPPHWLPGHTRWAVIGLALLAGMLAPDTIVRARRQATLRRIERGLPEALDLMVICAQAGLGLEAALERVAEEVRFANPAIAAELATTSAELAVGGDRRAVMMALGERTGLDMLKRFAATLVQTMQYGTPLSHVLRVLAAELRQDAMTRFEERAARLPVLLTVPMILFILPCVFVVVGGPAGLRIARMFAPH
jgi:tight adherence protein C